MAIQVRRGNESDFDASKMLPGEWAVSLDTKYVRMCFAPGVVLRMATYESFENDKAQIKAILAECKDIQSAVQRIQAEVNSKASLTIENANSAKESADKAHSEAERAKKYADNAEAVTGVSIATQERAGLIKGGDNHIAEDGTLMLITATTSTTQPNSYAGRENILEIGGGESEQDSTAGNQLLDISGLVEKTVNGITFTPQSDGGIKVKGTATAQADFYIIGSNSTGQAIEGVAENSNIYIKFKTEPKICYVRYLSDKVSANVVKDTVVQYASVCKMILRVTTGGVVDETLYIMVSNSDTSWEKYTGGIPAPNPSYPMEIKKTVVSGIKTHWKNIVKSCSYSATATNSYALVTDAMMSIKKGLTYTISVELTADSATKAYWHDGTGLFGNHVYLDVLAGTHRYSHTFKAQADYLYGENTILAKRATSDNVLITPKKLMVELNNTMTPYEPYTESSYTFSQPIELYGKDGVQDVITAKQTKRKFAKRVFDGSEYWNTSTALTGKYFCSNLGCNSGGKVLCTQAKSGNYNTTTINECYLSSNSGGQFRINTEFATVDEWKAHLASKPMEVVFELAEETTEALPIADQIALNSLPTYDGITYVEFDSEIQPTFKAEYGTSKVGGYTLESLLVARNNDLRLSALEASVVNNI